MTITVNQEVQNLLTRKTADRAVKEVVLRARKAEQKVIEVKAKAAIALQTLAGNIMDRERERDAMPHDSEERRQHNWLIAGLKEARDAIGRGK